MKKTTAGAGLVLVGLAVIFVVVSFWRENWSANQTPGAVEQFLARWLLSGARGGESDTPNPFPPTAENLSAGRDLYEKQCAFCHALDGAGTAATGIQFYPPVPSLTRPDLNRTDAQMHFVITRGIRYTAMPSFEKALTSEQIWKVVAWVRRLPPAVLPRESVAPSKNQP